MNNWHRLWAIVYATSSPDRRNIRGIMRCIIAMWFKVSAYDWLVYGEHSGLRNKTLVIRNVVSDIFIHLMTSSVGAVEETANHRTISIQTSRKHIRRLCVLFICLLRMRVQRCTVLYQHTHTHTRIRTNTAPGNTRGVLPCKRACSLMTRCEALRLCEDGSPNQT